MTCARWLVLLAIVSCCQTAPAAETGSRTEKPNLIWIWADNLGYGDLAVYGGRSVRTPAIDRLAAEGVRLTQYYVAHTVCSPSRAALLTGRQPFRTGVVDVLRPDSPTGLANEEITLAEALRSSGYATQAIGKWHLGDRPQYLPCRQGFDSYLGLPYSMDMLPTLLIRDDRVERRLPGEEVAHVTEWLTDEAIRFVTANKDRPYFLYFSHTIPHPPLVIPEEFRVGGRSTYEGALEYMDQQIGRLMETLDKLGLREKTLVVFSSDNGPMHSEGKAGALRGRIRDSYEGGVRVPLLASWPGTLPAGRAVDTPAIAYDIFPTLVHLAGGKVPDDRAYDGQDIWPLLSGRGEFHRKAPFFWVYDDRVTAVRDGQWKLHVGRHDRALAQPELYDVESDPGESHNVAAQHPQVVARLQATVNEYEKQIPKVWSLKYPVCDPARLPSGIRRE